MFQLLKYFDNFDNFTSHSMSLLPSTRKFGSKGLTLSKSNLDIMKNSSHRDEYPAMQSNGPLPQVLSVTLNFIYYPHPCPLPHTYTSGHFTACLYVFALPTRWNCRGVDEVLSLHPYAASIQPNNIWIWPVSS